jgi:hypothetical protein
VSDITWTNTRVKLGDLKPWADNPRTSSRAQAKRILRSFEQFGQVAPIAVGPGFEVYDGHQRLSALLTIHGPNFEVEARQSSKMLTDDERRGLVLALANATGSWNWEQLSGWDTADLNEWGFDQETLHGWNMDALNLREMLNGDAEPVDYEKEWEGMPEFEQEDLKPVKQILVSFKTMDDYEAFQELIGQKLSEKAKYVWYPKAERLIQDLVIEND